MIYEVLVKNQTIAPFACEMIAVMIIPNMNIPSIYFYGTMYMVFTHFFLVITFSIKVLPSTEFCMHFEQYVCKCIKFAEIIVFLRWQLVMPVMNRKQKYVSKSSKVFFHAFHVHQRLTNHRKKLQMYTH